MIFYCGLMVHITGTRAQKVFCCTSAHITETVLAHDQHWEHPINTTLEALSILILWNKSWYAHVFFSVMTDNS